MIPLDTYIAASLQNYDDYIKYLKKIDNPQINKILNLCPEFFKYYRTVYKLKLEITSLELQYYEHENQSNIDWLVLFNYLILISLKRILLRLHLNILVKEIQSIAKNVYSLSASLKGNDGYIYIKQFLTAMRLDDFFFKFDLLVQVNPYSVDRFCKEAENDMYASFRHNTESFDYSEDISTPVVRLDLDLNKKLHIDLALGWQKFNPKTNGFNDNGTYLVSFNLLKELGKNNKPALVFSYIKYNDNLAPYLVNYLEKATQDCTPPLKKSTNYIMEESFLTESFYLNGAFNYTKHNSVPKPTDLSTIIPFFFFKGPLFLDNQKIASFIKCFIYKKNEIMGFFSPEEQDSFFCKYSLTGASEKDISKFFFLVKDLKGLLNLLKDMNVNGGPQSNRAMVNTTGYYLMRTDFSFRKSLYCSYGDVLGKNLFNWKNIHVSNGSVRY